MYKITFTLKQHTPLIHFQHDQEGATLRATEVKPKLDKYIIERLTGQSGEAAFTTFKENPEWKKWLVGKGEHPALDYKLSFAHPSNLNYYLPLPMSFKSRTHPDRDNNLVSWLSENFEYNVELLEPTLFFANADKINFRGEEIDTTRSKYDELKFAVQTESNFKASIVSFNESLINSITANICEFFLTNNFGTRQNKGFGSYTVVEIEGDHQNYSRLASLFAFRSARNLNSNNQIFRFIKDEYQLLKSGINHPAYSKSKLFEHFVNLPTNPIRWEKRYFKQFINSNSIGGKVIYKKRLEPIDLRRTDGNDYNSYSDAQPNDYKFVRALLGLAEQFEFLVLDNGSGYPDNRDKYIVSVKHQPTRGGAEIDRFKSPLFFKVIDGDIYLKSDDSYRVLLNQEFGFELKLKSSPSSGTFIPPLKVPASFDLNNFLNNKISRNWTNRF